MDAVNFLKERERMCETIQKCHKCPISSNNNQYGLTCAIFAEKHPEEAVGIVEQWSKKHQIARNWQKFQEVFGTAIDPVTATVDWWSEEYKAPKGDKWSKEHPLITNRQKLKEVFGDEANKLSAPYEWWDSEYKEPKEEQ